MSQGTIKATRRELRRAMGVDGLAALAEAQQNIGRLSNSLVKAHERIDQLVVELSHEVEHRKRLQWNVWGLFSANFENRFGWLLRGRLDFLQHKAQDTDAV